MKHGLAVTGPRLTWRPSAAIAGLVALCPGVAAAHVKWFVGYNLQAPPRPALTVLSGQYFVAFCLIIGPLIFALTLVDRYLTRRECFLHRRANFLTEHAAPYFPWMLRIGVSAFFVAVFAFGCVGKPMILTPELHTHESWICWVQLCIAILAVAPRCAAAAGAGIVALYAYAILHYGLFHMLDYPIFLGVAAYLILQSVYGGRKQELAHSIVRVATGVTLLWASIEKFAFPEWSFMLMAQRPGITFGLNPEFYMVAAGFVEFCAAYLLITGLLTARAAALGLLVLFVMAIVPFGRIDAVGHSVIIVVLLLLTLSNNNVAGRLEIPRRIAATATLHASAFFAVLGLFLVLYYAGYYLSYTPAMA